MKRLLSILSACGWALALGGQTWAVETNSAVPITSELVNRLLGEVRTNNPSLRSADATLRAARLNASAVRIWDDPMVGFGGSIYSSRSFNPSEEGNLAYSVEQRLPLWGKPRLAKAVAEADVGEKLAQADSRLRELRRDLIAALTDAALAERLLELAEQDLSWLELISHSVEQRYRNGSAALADTLQVQNELAQRGNMLRADRQHLAHYHLALNRLLNRPVGASWPALRMPSVAPSVPYSAKLIALALAEEPRLKVQDWQIRQAAATAEATRKNRLPDFSLGAEGRQFSDDGGFRSGMFTLRMSFPWFNRDKYRQDYQRDLARKQAAEFQREDLVQSVREEIHHVTVEIDNAHREILLYTGEIGVRADQALSSRVADWETGRGMLREVLEARRMLLEANTMAARAQAEQTRMMADLLLFTGLDSFEALVPLSQEAPLFSHDDEHAEHAHE
ncbi:MAG TPA: TolC family protein [Candidatus Limnocylindria bacterium]|jgi:outer membrane protein TolC|nr:TolC family protein [Candidatus Limnocylindria bacterium]